MTLRTAAEAAFRPACSHSVNISPTNHGVWGGLRTQPAVDQRLSRHPAPERRVTSETRRLSRNTATVKEDPVKSLVIYESMYGNTHLIAKAIAAGLWESGETVLMPLYQVVDG